MRVDKPTGSPERELSWADLEAKFFDCAGQAKLSGNAADSFAVWRDVRRSKDVAALLAPLS